MRKFVKNYITAVTLLLLGTVEAISGFILWFVLPQGAGSWQGGRAAIQSTFWSLTRHTWIDIHDWVAIAIVVGIIVHLILHRKWILAATRRVFKTDSPAPATVSIED